ncbi:MAG: hypothetical protein P0Y49_20665 [Candidatus Pedobacter colombiensis]|uniref:Uncharacterized protein n=1 Tax=Candidatus Pedobacter colombiensis TaxID=3121371 RepID=A0AAJ5W730_9SPHI|nr:hypothetical protein [Pedobacter sp.]WEK19194.1 MAG: hypothetical protein P0Y49_20665 [Pedobacter sp.]
MTATSLLYAFAYRKLQNKQESEDVVREHIASHKLQIDVDTVNASFHLKKKLGIIIFVVYVLNK